MPQDAIDSTRLIQLLMHSFPAMKKCKYNINHFLTIVKSENKKFQLAMNCTLLPGMLLSSTKANILEIEL
jgi:Na+-transporting NADH:ubiquinone oxidoreductase subunit NqrB